MTTTTSSWPNPQPPAGAAWHHGPEEPDWHHGPGGWWPHGPGAPASPPVLLAVVPPTGPTVGGTQVTLLGLGFSGATAVRFGLTPASSFVVVSDNLITAVAPPGVGITMVSVTTSHGTSNGFPYIYAGAPMPPPVITSVVPNSGPIVGGTVVTITGSGFTGASAVSFGATPATSFTVLSDASVTAVAPPGTGTVSVIVTSPAGTSNVGTYTYV
ncbi:MAG: IPT/TIG domain-containing protein [Streptomycetaceae bacterium]|nr:IPT/TIG domain-containing protein [Streptomycetaceae bacterium]